MGEAIDDGNDPAEDGNEGDAAREDARHLGVTQWAAEPHRPLALHPLVVAAHRQCRPEADQRQGNQEAKTVLVEVQELSGG
ncbi:MAG TPA: hypothetical protein VFP55_12410 [Solirubrobacteraceae bacterium]|nr:hypothetical protein [Solirubrobacteraceae bacterium]